ncbi:hypothetical protein CHS0354_027894 [Potamilus streckersoni]|uniref:small monomeric GTPase n=1 Tax=Potamilus streckersoni TaxID=2493646 RepID=A0AAE0T3G7_9BIVA|nr:hypothetical protein CHS0354_027894 [Potamilus streckersoni]
MSGRKPFQKNGTIPEYNIALVGQLGVGKSALTVKYITRRFIMEYDPDIEDTYTKHEWVDNMEFAVHVMDTCDKPDSDSTRYLRWADAFMVVYSITDRSSFEAARRYLDLISQYQKASQREVPVALVGNKIELERYRQISKADGTGLASEYDASFFETTAAEDYEFVEEIFHAVVHEIQRHRGERQGIFQPLFISEERFQIAGRSRPKSPKISLEKKDDKNPSKKNPTSFKLFNKSFKIFN